MIARRRDKTIRILVLGAGELGMAVLRGLSRQASSASLSIGVFLRPQTAASTDPAKQESLTELRALGIDVVTGDLVKEDEAALSKHFQGYDLIIGCTGFSAGRGAQVKIAKAALTAGVERFVPWQFGVDYDVIGRGSAQELFDEQLDVRDLLRGQDGMEWVIISTGMFMSFLFEPSFGVVDLTGASVSALGGWDNRITVTTAEDIGRLTAAIVVEDPRVTNQIVRVAGDTLSYAALADVVEEALGKPLSRHEWPLDQLKAELARTPDDNLKKYRVIFGAGRGVAWRGIVTQPSTTSMGLPRRPRRCGSKANAWADRGRARRGRRLDAAAPGRWSFSAGK
jgi:hypothetical protein